MFSSLAPPSLITLPSALHHYLQARKRLFLARSKEAARKRLASGNGRLAAIIRLAASSKESAPSAAHRFAFAKGLAA
jgi:hypothetical protein